ncbi:DUF3667 domain-containing protein [Novosphingobium mangrovi (ex Huang et al. 2023)]|uniref:DUF3667 domain-containing protein n=1 Tax=Novosphingobium mangrovi (ex Huang et al. 2023) TaxID=2976432 RepID=A0ABT2IA52_9SPHN|nr:DUF3667 domain-containing protein [Novosphingobium mangrovi (ex Huang et al. 2023)]MCT2401681.1 DUF3667 domain-containing protein [Novosphingobium mangrovi (ex Huang et al. 2023)]
MSEISESLAEVGQGALAANAAEPEAGGAGDGHTHESACLNCGTALIGSHCHACGQAAHVHRTLGAFFHDLLHGVFHFEGKIWRTLPLLAWRPGKLTREYIDGRRASYISPIALFLFSVFLMFAVFHATQGHEEGKTTGNLIGIGQNVESVRADMRKLEAERAAAVVRGEATGSIDRQIARKKEALAALDSLEAEGLDIEISDKSGKGIHSDIPQIDKALKKFKANPDLATYKLQTYAYKYSWALIPISVPFLWLLFPFSRRFHLYDHTVFVTYSLCFMTMLVIVTMLAGALGAAWVGAVLFFAPPVHMYRQLRETYALGRLSALWRAWLLVWFSGTALLLFFILIMAQTGG